MIKPVTVSELVQSIRRLIEGVREWQKIWVTGEISGVKHHSSGHWYFTIKDDGAQMRAVMFRRDALNLPFPLKDGMSVLVMARVGVFERDGQTQLYVTAVQDLGTGRAEQALEALKQRLYQEGLFSRPKRPIPLLPRAVGVITSGTGAARYDIETVIARRYPGMPTILFPVLVQGRDAAPAIVAVLDRVHEAPIDVLIIGRGGGSREDLMIFNDESVVRAVFRSKVPVISAVGHEIDTTLVDLVADLRAPTPSAAAELAVPEYARLRAWHDNIQERVYSAMTRRLKWERERMAGWTGHGVLVRPTLMLNEHRYRLDRYDERIERSLERLLTEERHRVDRLAARAAGLNPTAVLDRGYAYVTSQSGQLVTADSFTQDEFYQVHWYNGSHWVKKVEMQEGRGGDGAE